MARFKIGQKVVAIRSHTDGSFKKGVVYILDGFSSCPNCGAQTIHLKGYEERINFVCNHHYGGCNMAVTARNVRSMFFIESFAPLHFSADAIEYKLKVSIPELTEIKETQLQ